MQTQILNYRIIVEPEKRGKKIVYNAFCPTLNVVDYGSSIDKVLVSIKDGIELVLGYLAEQKKEIPVDNIENQVVTSTSVNFPINTKVLSS